MCVSVTLWLHVGMCRYSCNGGLLLCWYPHTAALDFSVSFQGCAVFLEHVSILYKHIQCWRCEHCDERLVEWQSRSYSVSTATSELVELLGETQKAEHIGLQLHRRTVKNTFFPRFNNKHLSALELFLRGAYIKNSMVVRVWQTV